MTAVRTDALRLGTRGSLLARTQSAGVAAALEQAGQLVRLVSVRTAGDRSTAPLTTLGTTGVFVSALRDRLLGKEIDLAVHSYKDLPSAPVDGLVIAAVPRREDPRDALVARDGRLLTELPVGSRVGTGAPRRVAQLRALGLGLAVVGVRGNVERRLRAVADGTLDAVVVARAGLARLGRLDEATEVLDPLQVLPAPAQGALAIECRADDTTLVEQLRTLADPASEVAVTAERALLAALDAACTSPVAALADLAEGDNGPEVFLRATVTALDGSHAVRGSATGPPDDPAAVGRRLGDQLLDDGARDLL